MGTLKKSAGIAEVDVRALVRLMGETAALPGGHLSKKTYLLDGLCELIGADEWRWARVMLEPSARLIRGLRRTGLASRTPGNEALTSGDDALVLSNAPAGGIICSRRELAESGFGMIALCRDPGRPPYSARENRLAGLVLEEVGWLHDERWPQLPQPAEVDLSPRLRSVFDSLLASKSRKEITMDLGVSPNTVSGYIREIYRRFQVRSHRELLRRFLASPVRISTR